MIINTQRSVAPFNRKAERANNWVFGWTPKQAASQPEAPRRPNQNQHTGMYGTLVQNK
jgi:hypothetical protein